MAQLFSYSIAYFAWEDCKAGIYKTTFVPFSINRNYNLRLIWEDWFEMYKMGTEPYNHIREKYNG